jgi:hypothetical protein
MPAPYAAARDQHHSDPVRPDVRRDGMTATGDFDKFSRRRAFLKPYRVPQIVVYLLRFNLKIAPKLVVISAVKEIHVANPEDSGTDN